MSRKLQVLAVVWSLALAACGGTDDPVDRGKDTEDLCLEVSCGDNAQCEATTGECACDEGFVEDGGACVDSRMVACEDVAPENATSVEADVEVSWDGEAWGEPAACEWSCDEGFERAGDACVETENTKLVACADEAPENATSIEADVLVVWDGENWSEPEACAWSCDEGFGELDGQCVSTQTVACADEAPENATSIEGDVEVEWTGEGWADPAACEWSCDEGFDLVGEACVNAQTVDCEDVAPDNAASDVVPVEIVFEDGTWSEPAACEWSCDEGFDLVGEACVNTQMVTCTDIAPDNASSQIDLVEIVFADGAWSAPAACEWSCDTDYAEEGGACIDSKQVACATDAVPANATAVDAQVTVTFTTAGGWTTPAACEWNCDTDFFQDGDACIDTRMEACTDAAPANATSTVVDVEVTYTSAGGWSAPAACEWSCDEDYDLVDGQCLNSQMVACVVDGVPANATAVDAQVEIVFTDGAWSEPAACGWSCNEDYDEDGGACINSKQVACSVDGVPANATATVEDVTVTYTSAGGWSAPAACEWSCDEGFERDDDTCIAVGPDLEIGWCNVQWPETVVGEVGVEAEIFGQVYVAGGTDVSPDDAMPGVTAMVCKGLAGALTLPLDLTALECEEASFNVKVGNNDEYGATVSFDTEGDWEYIYAFSLNNGADWTLCDLDGIVGNDLNPGTAEIEAAPPEETLPFNGDFELWNEGETMPLGWTKGSALGVAREETVVRNGSASVKLTRNVADNTNVELSSELSPVEGGKKYVIELWFFDNEASVRGRHIYEWFDADGKAIGSIVYGSYTSNQDTWQSLSVTATAPANAHFVRVATRVYGEPSSSTGGSVYLDDVSVKLAE